MVTEPLLQMLPEVDVRTILGDGLRGGSNMNMEDSLVNDIESMLREHQSNANMDRERDLNIFRSGSAPPTVEGSLNAVGSLFRNSDTQFAGINRNDHSNGILSEEEIRSHPAYLQYYYSHDNLNPRLPPPLLSKEDWRIARRFQNGSTSYVGIGDRRNELVFDYGGNKSLFSLQPGGLPSPNKDMDFGEVRKVTPRHPRQSSAEWIEKGTDGLIGLAGVGLGERRKSLADMLQEGLGRPAPIPGHHSRPASRNSFDSVVDPVISAPIPGHHSRPASRNSFDGVLDSLASGPQLAQLQNGVNSLDGLHSGATAPGLVRVRSLGSSISHSFASAVVGASLSRSPTPDAPLVGRSTTPSLPPQAGRVAVADKKITAGSNVYTDHSSGMGGHADVAHSLSFLSLSASSREDSSVQALMEQEFKNQPNLLFGMPNGHSQRVQQHFIGSSGAKTQNIPTIYEDMAKTSGAAANVSQFNMDEQMNLPKTSSATGPYTNVSSAGSQSLEGSSIQYQNAEMKRMTISGHSSSGYPLNQRENPSMTNHHDAEITMTGNPEGQNLNRNGNHAGSAFQAPLVDPLYVQYLQRTSDVAAQLNDPTLGRNYMNTSNMDLFGFQKAYIAALVAQQKQQYGMPFLGKSGGLNQGYYGSPTFGVGMPYPGSPIATSVLPSLGPGTPIRQNERIAGFPSMMTSPARGSMGSWQSVNGRNIEENSSSSLLEEFKNNKTRCFELSEIIDHAVEFSTDQYGSRFIQQKLETATNEEKTKIFPEIIPHAHALMTDVFGNYVIQKFFEYGTESQRKELTSQLTGHILPLSLQMYGCRVIQKALEVVDVDRQTQMVAELDGSVMKCVRDQNGNHVIQKCIECVPQDRIQFIITAFYGQVVPLSTHPYGCRVIQRVLEHCDDANTQRIVMEEIMHSVCTLAQDQYGNYVVQHVLQHGKPHERSAIISKLAGQIIKMSQQKFASNVVEKCLTFGGPDERQLLVNEMLGFTDENEPLQAMMKDPYGNYVVQKVLETCDNQSRELILSRIKVHLNTLKRYTYGKHIVARVEKLITAGERRMGIAASQSA